jgi:hypothetical protein
MRRTRLRPFALVLGAIALAFASSASAKDGKDEGSTKESAAHLRWARTYAAAMTEAKARGCVIFATFHSDG